METTTPVESVNDSQPNSSQPHLPMLFDDSDPEETEFIKARRLSAVKAKNRASFGNNGKYWDLFFANTRHCHDHAVYKNWSEARAAVENQTANGAGSDEDSDEPQSDTDVVTDAAEESEDGHGTVSDRDLISKILESFGASNALWETKVLNKFLSREDDESLVAEDEQEWAWVDDRNAYIGRSRDHQRSLDAQELQEILEHPRFEHPTLQDVDQRMIYISRLTLKFVGALVKTAWQHQMDALRDAIWKHITFETSLRVHMPILGFRTYRLEFHMAHLFLRESDDTTDPAANNSFANPSFLKLANSDGDIVPQSIYQGHMSVVICGWSNWQWTGYAFTHTDNEVEAEDNDEFMGHFLSCEYGFDFDTVQEPAKIWDAREYWLRLVAHRCQYVLQEWLYLVRTIEDGIEEWKSQDPCNSATAQSNVGAKDIQKSLDKTFQTIQLVRKLSDALSNTLRAHDRYDRPGGDKSYFADIENHSFVQNSIVESFEKLTDLSLRLRSLDDSCQQFATHLGRILNLENNQLIMKSNQLNQESNMHQQASHQLSERTHKLNEETSVLNKEMRKLNERSTEAACANQAEAMKTSRSTRVNVELLLLTTPFGMVLQYFSSEQEILFFKRSPTTFILATIILMLLLRLLTLALEHGDSLWRRIYRKVATPQARSQPPGGNQDAIELENTHSV